MCLFPLFIFYLETLPARVLGATPRASSNLFSIVLQLSKMRPEEYRAIIKRLETHYQEFTRTSQGSEMFGEDEKKVIQGHFDQAQTHYDTLIIQLPAYSESTLSVPYSEECGGFSLVWYELHDSL